VQVVPNTPHPESTGSERQVLKLLRNLDWGAGARALNSLNLPDHVYQRWGEIDFLLIGTPGLIAIEVKGGDVSCSNGYWRYEDRLGRVVKRAKSPIVQAKDAYFSLMENYVAEPMGHGFPTSVPTGFCVLLAGAGRRDLAGLLGTPELPEQLTGTREDMANAGALGAFLRRVAKYWQAKSSAKPTIDPRDVERLIRLLRPEFDKVMPLALSSEQSRQELIQLTEEQYEALDHWQGADRILCTAPAGCGKTLLAVEMFKRSRNEGADSLLLCGTHNLAKAIANALGDGSGIFSMAEVVAMPAEDRPTVDILIVDEGQQALDPSGMALMDQLVRGGIHSGRWAWFGDPNHQLPIDEKTARVAFDTLRRSSSVQPVLRKNCRNTPEIVQFTELASGVRIGHAISKGRGLVPRLQTAEGPGPSHDLIAAQVKEWMSQEIPPSEVCIIVSGEDPRVSAEGAGARGGFTVAPWQPLAKREAAVRYCQVDDFRGLESPFLILYVPAFNEGGQELARMFYLAMTRANFALTMVAPADVMERLRTIVESSLKASGG
jgi:hypothetical protein